MVELQKKIAEAETRMRQQQALYEAVRADRNLYSKNLIEAQDEISENRRKFKTMQHHNDQLKEEIAAKDLALVKEHFDHMKVRGGSRQASRGLLPPAVQRAASRWAPPPYAIRTT